jgi:hypothetical protein
MKSERRLVLGRGGGSICKVSWSITPRMNSGIRGTRVIAV